MKRIILLIIWLFVMIVQAFSQYYGRNKIKYEHFKFKVLETQHFQFYYYLQDTETIKLIAQLAEKWYQRHSKIFKDTVPFKNPVILYNNHADFQQNTVSNELVDVGTGGFTEGNKNRVVMPLGISLGRTDHVLGHELVHAFQYSLIRQDSSLSIRSIMNIPLWMVEGMAEYLSLGSTDPFTAMWIRDAVATDKFPRFKDLYDFRYFPYRWGQAFWAFIDGIYGQDIFVTLYKQTARFGYKKAFKQVLGVNEDTLAKVWKDYTYEQYKPLMVGRWLTGVGKRLIDSKNGGRINVSPVISPDGHYLAFLSERDVFTFEMFLADAQSGKIIRKLRVRTNDGHIDAADVYESTGSFSPDSRRLAFVVYEKGNNALIIIDVLTGKIENEIFIPQIDAFTTPAWSPDGQNIVLAAIRNSQTDLIMYNLKTRKLRWLTKDIFAQFQPSWSPSGRYLVFATDSISGVSSPTRKFRIGLMDVKTGKISLINVFPNANNLNPVFSPDESKIYFLSDVEGFRDLYQYDLKTQKVHRLTKFYTGISGITMLSPAIAVNYKTKQIVYSLYYDNAYTIYAVNIDSLKPEPVQLQDIYTAGFLPPQDNLAHIINRNIAKDILIYATLAKDVQFDFKPYRRKIQVEYISNVGLGVSTSRYWGTSVNGGINLLLGDVLGENRIFVGFQGGQGLESIGGGLAYLNQKNRLWWGVSYSHIPYQIGSAYYKYDTIQFYGDSIRVINAVLDIITIFNDNLTVFATYPLTQTRRFEFALSGNVYSFLHTIYNNYFSGYVFIGASKERMHDVPKPFGISTINLGYIEDNSYFGMTSPLKGHIITVFPTVYMGAVNFTALDIDLRKYFYLKPVSFAFRLLQYWRFGKDAESGKLPDFYLAYPWYIRGYNQNSLLDYLQIGGNPNLYYSLTGSRMIVFNFETRLPFIGIDRLALISSKFLFADLNAFFDAGLAWHTYDIVEFSGIADVYKHIPLMSIGLSTRINFFGQMIFEPYIAYPLSFKGYNSYVVGINLMSGW